ncbi:MAG: hypothetical protein J6S62_06285 [Bacteroidales bacterium]|nr:hypothetical protein [Bacteroidales bacterium]
MLKLESESLILSLHEPGDGFYRGTRFDAAGVFGSLSFGGRELCGRWFEKYDPYMHDAVCGPAEEFSPVFLDGCILKIGVGLLDPLEGPYDRFRLYPVLEKGERSLDIQAGYISFRHRLPGCYDYVKQIVVTGPDSFDIRHQFSPQIPVETEVYNHNFFTLGRLSTGPERRLLFPFKPACTWRAQYDSVTLTGSGLQFSRSLEPGESVYSGDIHQEGGEGMPYEFCLREGGISVLVKADVPALRMVFWANHRIACPEPYNSISARPGEHLRWTVSYRILQDEN